MRRKVAIWVVLIILLLTSGCGNSGWIYALAGLGIYGAISEVQYEAYQDARIKELEDQQENDPNSTKEVMRLE